MTRLWPEDWACGAQGVRARQRLQGSPVQRRARAALRSERARTGAVSHPATRASIAWTCRRYESLEPELRFVSECVFFRFLLVGCARSQRFM